MLQPIDKKTASSYSSLTLAFLGDSVFEILVRHKIVLNGDKKIDKLNSIKVGIVCAKFQAKVVPNILQLLSDEELAIFKRGRNSKCHAPKNTDILDYRLATGLECLFGYLYLIGDEKRIDELFSIVWNIYKEDF
ncbi:MAG: Mini-ribonuclease 3 [Oscillospiraceae bacterium]